MLDIEEKEIHPNLKLLSDSSVKLLHLCPRKYELYKLLGRREEVGNPDTTFGKVVGLGTQILFSTGSLNQAIFSCFLAWPTFIDDEEGTASKKTFWHAIYAIEKFHLLRQTELSNYELAYFDGKPAVELGFSISLGNGWFYRGLLDMLLVNNLTKELVVYEGKTTKFKNVHEATFKHSGQSLGYSIVVDTIAEKLSLKDTSSSYEVNYAVYKTSAYEWELFPFKKTHHQRALWIRDLLLEKQYVEERALEDYFPMRGESCYAFFRPCEYFGYCEMSNAVLLRGEEVEVLVEGEEKYQFRYSLEEIIEAQLAKQGVEG